VGSIVEQYGNPSPRKKKKEKRGWRMTQKLPALPSLKKGKGGRKKGGGEKVKKRGLPLLFGSIRKKEKKEGEMTVATGPGHPARNLWEKRKKKKREKRKNRAPGSCRAATVLFPIGVEKRGKRGGKEGGKMRACHTVKVSPIAVPSGREKRRGGGGGKEKKRGQGRGPTPAPNDPVFSKRKGKRGKKQKRNQDFHSQAKGPPSFCRRKKRGKRKKKDTARLLEVGFSEGEKKKGGGGQDEGSLQHEAEADLVFGKKKRKKKEEGEKREKKKERRE